MKNRLNLLNFNFTIAYEALRRISSHPYGNWRNSNLIIVPPHFGRHDEDQASSIMAFDVAGDIFVRYAFFSSLLVNA